jgi:hypothetical protein
MPDDSRLSVLCVSQKEKSIASLQDARLTTPMSLRSLAKWRDKNIRKVTSESERQDNENNNKNQRRSTQKRSEWRQCDENGKNISCSWWNLSIMF